MITNIKDYVEQKVESFFADIVKEAELKSGDVSPDEDCIIDDFKAVVYNYIKSNS